jgi:hypothetical protein
MVIVSEMRSTGRLGTKIALTCIKGKLLQLAVGPFSIAIIAVKIFAGGHEKEELGLTPNGSSVQLSIG